MDTYITLQNLKTYNEESNKIIEKKQNQLVGTNGQVLSFDEKGNVVPKNFEEIGEIPGQFITMSEYEQLEKAGLVEKDKNYYILGNPIAIATEDEIANLQLQIDELRRRLDTL